MARSPMDTRDGDSSGNTSQARSEHLAVPVPASVNDSDRSTYLFDPEQPAFPQVRAAIKRIKRDLQREIENPDALITIKPNTMASAQPLLATSLPVSTELSTFKTGLHYVECIVKHIFYVSQLMARTIACWFLFVTIEDLVTLFFKFPHLSKTSSETVGNLGVSIGAFFALIDTVVTLSASNDALKNLTLNKSTIGVIKSFLNDLKTRSWGYIIPLMITALISAIGKGFQGAAALISMEQHLGINKLDWLKYFLLIFCPVNYSAFMIFSQARRVIRTDNLFANNEHGEAVYAKYRRENLGWFSWNYFIGAIMAFVGASSIASSAFYSNGHFKIDAEALIKAGIIGLSAIFINSFVTYTRVGIYEGILDKKEASASVPTIVSSDNVSSGESSESPSRNCCCEYLDKFLWLATRINPVGNSLSLMCIMIRVMQVFMKVSHPHQEIDLYSTKILGSAFGVGAICGLLSAQQSMSIWNAKKQKDEGPADEGPVQAEALSPSMVVH